MVDKKHNVAIISLKHNFFSNYIYGATSKSDIHSKLLECDNNVKTIGYSVLLNNHQTIVAEFNHTFNTLKKQKNNQFTHEFWLYCYYLASLLESFHKAYGQANKVTELAQYKMEIKNHFIRVKQVKGDKNYVNALQERFNGSY